MKKTIKNNILKKIKLGEIRMRSRLEVLGERLGVGGGMLLLLAGLIVISGLVEYWFRLNSDLVLGGYGKYGLGVFIRTFPYVFVITFAALFFLLSLILRRFDFSYKKPFIPFLLALTGVVLAAGLFSLDTSYGRGFYRNEGRFFGIGRMMNGANTVNGEVSQIGSDTLILETEDGKKVTVRTTNATHYPFGTPKAGDIVRAVGAWKGNNFEAAGVRVFDKNDVSPMTGGYGMGGQGKGSRRLR